MKCIFEVCLKSRDVRHFNLRLDMNIYGTKCWARISKMKMLRSVTAKKTRVKLEVSAFGKVWRLH